MQRLQGSCQHPARFIFVRLAHEIETNISTKQWFYIGQLIVFDLLVNPFYSVDFLNLQFCCGKPTF